MDLKELQHQVNARWGAQEGNPCHLSSPDHALIHMMKAIGKIADAQNAAEHEGRRPYVGEICKYLADLVICAARYSPNADLDKACVERLAEKFPEI